MSGRGAGTLNDKKCQAMSVIFPIKGATHSNTAWHTVDNQFNENPNFQIPYYVICIGLALC